MTTAKTAYHGLSAATNAKAEQIARQISTYQTGRDKATGTTLYLVPSSDDPEHTGHWVSPYWCSCRSFAQRGVCSHQAGILRACRRQQALEDAAFDAEIERVLGPAPAPRSKYERLFPGCKDCGDLADGLDDRCSKCASDREWQARRDMVVR